MTDRLSVPRLLALHLVPGALGTLLFVLIAPRLETAGYPPALALIISFAVAIVPWELGVVLWSGRESPNGLLGAVTFRDPLSTREWLVLLPTLLILSASVFLALSLLEPAILESFFNWLPQWFVELIPLDNVGGYTVAAWTITLIFYVAVNVILGPAVEELYFRGYLLPRMAHLGWWAPFVSSVLFSLYHFWSPWGFLSRAAGVSPFVYAVQWKRNVYLGMAVHVVLNGISTALIIASVAPQLG